MCSSRTIWGWHSNYREEEDCGRGKKLLILKAHIQVVSGSTWESADDKINWKKKTWRWDNYWYLHLFGIFQIGCIHRQGSIWTGRDILLSRLQVSLTKPASVLLLVRYMRATPHLKLQIYIYIYLKKMESLPLRPTSLFKMTLIWGLYSALHQYRYYHSAEGIVRFELFP